MANELTKDEKLEKLLKMAGFKLVPKKEDAIFGNVSQWWYDICNHWEYPDGKKYKTHPDLLHSLDAQEKWLVPVLLELGYEVTIVIYRTGLIVTIRSLKLQADVVRNYYHNTNIAQAFADAVLKLMEVEK